MVAAVCDLLQKLIVCMWPWEAGKLKLFLRIYFTVIIKSFTEMNNDNMPPTCIEFKNIWMRNYTLIWNGLTFVH